MPRHEPSLEGHAPDSPSDVRPLPARPNRLVARRKNSSTTSSDISLEDRRTECDPRWCRVAHRGTWPWMKSPVNFVYSAAQSFVEA
jgi:hypothetical protein